MTQTRPNTEETHSLAAEDISAELIKIDSLIATAARLVDDGRLVDLGALERRTADVCDAALALPAAESREMLPALKSLIDNLDLLADRLTQRFGHLPKLDSAPPPGAVRAYGKTQGSD